MIDTPHIAYPFRLVAGTLSLVEQDSQADIEQCVHLLMRTRPGARPLTPEIGIEDPTFTAGPDADEITQYLAEYEDRARCTVTVETNGATRTVRISVTPAEDAEPTDMEDVD